jgi:predicted dehydrogenase
MARRDALGLSATGLLIVPAAAIRGSAANSTVRLGLLGCGGRGVGVATSFGAHTPARVVALADLFPDKLVKAQQHFNEVAAKRGHAGIDPAQLFRGPRAFEEIAASKEVDAVLVTTPPYIHPEHAEAVISAGKHIYLEKPVAVDVPGVRRVQAAAAKAAGKLSFNVGLQIRRAPPFVEMVRRIHAGALGTISFGQAYFYGIALKWPQYPNATGDELKLRRWTHHRILSGDILVEQGVHIVDVCNWVLGAHPLTACGAGGRKVRTDEGDSWDHYSITYTYPGGINVSFSSTQFNKGWWDACERFFGSRGVSESHYNGGVRIHGEEPWEADLAKGARAISGAYGDALQNADSEKQKAFIESILTGRFHQEAGIGCEATLSAILGRTSAYTGKPATWEQILKSDDVWAPGFRPEKFA